MECAFEGCIRGVFANGMCSRHYELDRLARAPKCSEADCERPQRTAGLCTIHYRASLRAMAPRCEVEGCNRAAVSRGLCDSHRKRKERRGHLDPSRPADWGARASHPLYETWYWHKRRGAAGIEPAWRDFWRFVEDVGDRPGPNHRLNPLRRDEPIGPGNYQWSVISRVPEGTVNRNAAHQRERRQRHPDERREQRFKRTYGISMAEYRALHEEQRGLCLICKRAETSLNQHTHEPRLLSVDHCHSTGKVRGLLCKRCNTGIGAFEEDPELLKAAIRYVRRHKTPSDEG